MRKEYDLGRLTVKRRGPLPGLSGTPEAPETDVEDRVQVTLTLDRGMLPLFLKRSLNNRLRGHSQRRSTKPSVNTLPLYTLAISSSWLNRVFLGAAYLLVL
ncbi:MAG: hypothetical protein ACYCQM_00495 [Acidithiobacillus sp.]